MGKKGYVTIYIDLEIVKEAKELGLNISKTCENALKEAITRLKGEYSRNKLGNCDNGSPGEIRTPVSGSKARYACPLHHRASLRIIRVWSKIILTRYLRCTYLNLIHKLLFLD